MKRAKKFRGFLWRYIEIRVTRDFVNKIKKQLLDNYTLTNYLTGRVK